MQAIRKYYLLTKPGIIFGNSITAFGGFCLASKNIDFLLLSKVLLGLGLIVGAGCTFNNFLDRVSDRLMLRTKNRPLAQKEISETGALFYGLTLLFLGFLILLKETNPTSSLIALIGFVVYVLFYSFLKYKTAHATLIGAIAGATPPVVGYTAVSNQLDLAAFLIFLIVTFWQMPHFFAIAFYRLQDYASASIPVLPLKKGSYRTKMQMIFFTLCFILATSLITFIGKAGLFYFSVNLALGGGWLFLVTQGLKTQNDAVWARKIFAFSLLVIFCISATIFFEKTYL